ncbi:MAG: hypothetical protein JNN01_04265 [Opitutaceae bacterium]|nr:hypothetical protein [Opitutaceae bacterium]
MLVLLGLAILCMGGLGYMVFSMRGENRKLAVELEAQRTADQRAELERQKAVDLEKRTIASNRQNELLAQVRPAIEALERLDAEVKRINQTAEALRSNDDGRRIALAPKLVEHARVFFSTELPELTPQSDVASKLEALRRTEAQVVAATNTVYQPEGSLVEDTKATAKWAKDELEGAQRVSIILESLIGEGRGGTPGTLPSTAEAQTLQTAMKRLEEKDAAAARTTLSEETTKAKEEGVKERADAEADRIREEARRDAARIRAEADELKAEVERELASKKANEVKQTAKLKVEMETAVDEARRIELRKKAADPQIQAKLAPFITPGYWQLNEFTLELKPLSYTKLRNVGALEPTIKGGALLAKIVSSIHDKVRPRWKIGTQTYMRQPAQIERIKETQQLLTELGPVLVEMKLLEP